MTEYRITYSIQRRRPTEDDFSEIGFGSSMAWSEISSASHDIASAIENYDWETGPEMPDPAGVDI